MKTDVMISDPNPGNYKDVVLLKLLLLKLLLLLPYKIIIKKNLDMVHFSHEQIHFSSHTDQQEVRKKGR